MRHSYLGPALFSVAVALLFLFSCATEAPSPQDVQPAPTATPQPELALEVVPNDSVWVETQAPDLSPLPAPPPTEIFVGLLPYTVEVELHVFQDGQYDVPGPWRTDFPLTFHDGFYSVEVGPEGTLDIRMNDLQPETAPLAAQLTFYNTAPVGAVRVCSPCQAVEFLPERDIVSLSLLGEKDGKKFGGPVVFVRFRDGQLQVDVPGD